MTDAPQIVYNEWDEPDPMKDYGLSAEPLDLTKWPDGAKPDGKRYRIGWCQNQRALMQNGDRHPDNPELGEDGLIQWVSIDPRFKELPDSLRETIDGTTGSYGDVSHLCDTLNNRADKMGGAGRAFTFYPHPLEEVGQR